MTKLLLCILVGIFFISFISAESIGTIARGEDIELYQTCNNCTYCNFTTIKYPNKTNILTNIVATKDETYFYYNLDGGNTSNLGEYTYCYDCGNVVDSSTGCIEFTVTPTGRILNPSESLIYFILAFGVFLLFVLSFYFTIVTPYGNDINEKGAVIKITKLKYIKLGFVLLTWVLFTWFLNILIGLSDNFVSLTMYYGFFGFMFDLMNRLALPLGVIIIVIMFFEIIRDTNIQKAISKFGSHKK